MVPSWRSSGWQKSKKFFPTILYLFRWRQFFNCTLAILFANSMFEISCCFTIKEIWYILVTNSSFLSGMISAFVVSFKAIETGIILSIFIYPKVSSTSPSCLEAHVGFIRLSMKEKFWCLFTVTFWENFDFHIINKH